MLLAQGEQVRAIDLALRAGARARCQDRGGHAGGGRARAHSEGAVPLRWKRESRREGARNQPQRALSPPGRAWPLSLGVIAGRLTHESRVFALAILAGAAGSGTALGLLWFGEYDDKVRWTLTLFVLLCWLSFAMATRERVVRPLQTISNMLAALREGDFSTRARGARDSDALGLALLEVNMLATTLRSQRLSTLEATSLLRTVMEEIDVAIFTFDETHRLRLLNRAGERLLAQRSERLLGRTGAELGLEECLGGDADAHRGHDVPRRRGPMAASPHDIPAGWAAASAGGAVGSEQGTARRRAVGMATDYSRARTRDQQFAGAHQIDRRESAGARRRAGSRCGIRGRRQAGARRDLQSRRLAEPLHDFVRDSRPTARPSTQQRGRADVGAAHGEARDAAARRGAGGAGDRHRGRQ